VILLVLCQKLGPKLRNSKWEIEVRSFFHDHHLIVIVASWEHGGRKIGEGGYSEYLRVEAAMATKIPEHLSYEEAATIPLALLTVSIGFEAIAAPNPDSPSSDRTPFLVWSASTSTGQYAVQLAKLSGCKVIATASPKNFEYIKSLGADHVFDYKDKDVVAKIREVAPTLKFSFDGISEQGSANLIEQCFGSEGGKICAILPYTGTLTRTDVKIENVLVYTIFGRDFNFIGKYFPAVSS
jgi:NADPH:quinone reductase-like Zn-dependent oxidoreductase